MKNYQRASLDGCKLSAQALLSIECEVITVGRVITAFFLFLNSFSYSVVWYMEGRLISQGLHSLQV